ncbi:MAG: CBS domain-containing protein [Archangium gephyra]|uniref:CBS domain-containing protein n=1 Tax=Archangium gephyra TaxID=48 RepID=A0A2W5TWV7_9BACT|nr:MAG: CBS domain-containing protein [Archangium gephyra]
MSQRTIDQFMTRSPHTIGHEQTLTVAHRLMSESEIRHLPVLERGRLIGIVSQRDLHMVQTLGNVDPDRVQVNQAMTEGAFSVDVSAPLQAVAATMAQHKYGCVVVLEHERVVGVFTATDALRVLSDLLAEQPS